MIRKVMLQLSTPGAGTLWRQRTMTLSLEETELPDAIAEEARRQTVKLLQGVTDEEDGLRELEDES